MEQDRNTGSTRSQVKPEAAIVGWRLEEYCRQAIVFVALDAIRSARYVSAGSGPPLGPVLSKAEAIATTRLLDVLLDRPRPANLAPRQLQEAHAEIERVLSDVRQRFGAAGRAEAWPAVAPRPAEYIEWWVVAAEGLREARAAIPRLEEHESRAARAAGKTSIIQRAKESFGTAPASQETDATVPSTRLRILLERIRHHVGPGHPVIWIADQEGPLRLTAAAFDVLKNGSVGRRLRLEEPCAEARECLEKLVSLCGSLRPLTAGDGSETPCPAATFQAWRGELARTAGTLLQTACAASADPWPTDVALDHWDVEFNASGHPATVLATPLFAEYADDTAGPRVVAKGVIVVPRADALVGRLREWCDQQVTAGGQRAACLQRAIAAAAPEAWGARFSTAVVAGPTQPFTAATLDRLRTLARLLGAIAGWRSASGVAAPAASRSLDPAAELQMVAMLTGVMLKPAPGPISRVIPRAPGDSGGAVAAGPLGLQLPDGKFLPVGTPAEPASCTPRTFEAVEDLDWRLWAIAAAAAPSSGLPADARETLRKLLRRANHDRWEALKARLLASDDDPATLADGVWFCVSARIQLEQTSADEAIRAGLIGGVRRCANALLERLHVVDPDRLGGLQPPRGPDGSIDVSRWRQSTTGPDHDPEWLAKWKAAPEAFGTQLAEQAASSRTVRVTFSASPAATDDDVRLLELPFVAPAALDPGESWIAPLARFGSELLAAGTSAGALPDVAAALERLRGEFIDTARPEFDALVKAATGSPPDARGVRWLAVLGGDPRFRFACHPPIATAAGGGFTARPLSSRDNAWWEDSDTVPDGADLRVVHAIEWQDSLRVVSRGRPADGSPEQLAARLEALCETALPALVPSARELRRAIDRLRAFPAERADAVHGFVSALCATLDQIVGIARAVPATTVAGERESALGEAFAVLSQVAALHGATVSPAEWHAAAGAPAAAVAGAEDLVAAFHPTVAAGDLIVDLFAVAGELPRAGRWRRSAGPAPAGYAALCALADALPGDDARCRELSAALADLPGHVLAEKSRLAIPGLYERVWSVLVESAAAAGDQAAWRAAVADLIRKPFDMVMFEPSKLGDYPSAWIVASDGRAPRGRRIVRVVRPGVRTLEKKLVWPAVVETE